MVVGTLCLIQKGQNSGRSTQWNSGIWWWGQYLLCKKVNPVDSLDAVHSGHTTIYHYSTASTASTV